MNSDKPQRAPFAEKDLTDQEITDLRLLTKTPGHFLLRQIIAESADTNWQALINYQPEPGEDAGVALANLMSRLAFIKGMLYTLDFPEDIVTTREEEASATNNEKSSEENNPTV